MNGTSESGRPLPVAPPRAAVTAFVIATAVAACAALATAYAHRSLELEPGLFAFIALVLLTGLREVRLPVVGHVTLSFVPVLAALVVFGLWPALVVVAFSGLATVAMTHDVEKILFNVSSYVVSMFVAGIVYLALLPGEATLSTMVLPAFAATGVDFLVSTALLATVIALAQEEKPFAVWQRNYQWGFPSYLTGASLALLVAWLYLRLGLSGLILGLPPLFLIWYSYDVYVGRVRDRATYSSEAASFREELAQAAASQAALRDAQRRVSAEIERARRIQADLLPHKAPEVPGLELAHRIEFMTEMGGDYFDFVPLADGRLGLVCGDVMGKGLSAALIMTMARTLIQSGARDGRRPGLVLAEMNDALTRDLAGQTAPSFLTLAYAIYTPDTCELVIANGGHNPLLVFGPAGLRQVPSRGGMLGVRAGLEYPEDELQLAPGESFALFTDGLTEARDARRQLFGVARLAAALEGAPQESAGATLDAAWRAVADFRGGAPASDDATLLLGRVTGIESTTAAVAESSGGQGHRSKRASHSRNAAAGRHKD